MFPPGVKLRNYQPETDLSYLTDSWRRSFERSNWAGSLTTKIYVETYKKTIQCILDYPTTKISIACVEANKDYDIDENFIVGYVVYDLNLCKFPVVHYLYVKDPFRRKGIASGMLDYVTSSKSIFKYTFRTKSCEYLRGKYYGQYSPRILRPLDRHPGNEEPDGGSNDLR